MLEEEGGSGDGAGLEPEVLDESKGKSIDTHEGTSLKPGVPDVSKADSSDSDVDLNKTDGEEETREDEFVHKPDDYLPTDDETKDVDDEEYVMINEEIYDDVNVELKDAELVDEGKGDEEMTDAENVNVENEEVNQENAKIEIISMLDVQVQHENPTTPATAIPSLIPTFIPHFQKSTLIPTPTNTEATTSTPAVQKSKTLSTFHLIASDLEKNPKHGDLYHALIKSILEDEDAMDKGVVDKLKKRKPDDVDRDEDPYAGPDQGLKRKKTSKDVEPSKKAKSTDTSKCTTKSQPKSTGKSAQAEETVFEDGDTQLP
nr:hypothetical protein [Tanacetum cinerariifolium]